MISLLAIGAVSAADAYTDTISTDKDVVDELDPTMSDVPVPESEPKPIEKPEATEDSDSFNKLNDEIVAGQINHESNVTLDKDYKNAGGEEGITLKIQTHESTNYDKIKIEGNNHIIDANYNSTIFIIEENMHVTLQNLIFINAVSNYGGAIYNEGDKT